MVDFSFSGMGVPPHLGLWFLRDVRPDERNLIYEWSFGKSGVEFGLGSDNLRDGKMIATAQGSLV